MEPGSGEEQTIGVKPSVRGGVEKDLFSVRGKKRMRMPRADFPAPEIEKEAEGSGLLSGDTKFTEIQMPFAVVRLIVADETFSRAVGRKVKEMRWIHVPGKNIAARAFVPFPPVSTSGNSAAFDQFLTGGTGS